MLDKFIKGSIIKWPWGEDRWDWDFDNLIGEVAKMESRLMEEIGAEGITLCRSGKQYDIKKDEKNMKIFLPVPGLDVEDIEILVDTKGKYHTLTIKIKDDLKNTERARFVGRMRMDYILSEDADINNISPSLEKGILIIDIPLIESKQLPDNIKKIPINKR